MPSRPGWLALRVQPTGARAWKVIYRAGGRPRWLHLGNARAIGLSDARRLAAEAMLAVARGADPAAERRAARNIGAFAELATSYVEQHAKKHNRIRGARPTRWSAAISSRAGGSSRATAITRADVKAMMARIKAPIVANQTLAAASAIFTWAVKEELVVINPCRSVDRNPTASRERVLSNSELPLFWKAFDDAGLIAGTAR